MSLAIALTGNGQMDAPKASLKTHTAHAQGCEACAARAQYL
jgi:hypothetical protein